MKRIILPIIVLLNTKANSLNTQKLQLATTTEPLSLEPTLAQQASTHIPNLPPGIAINATLPSKPASTVLIETIAFHTTIGSTSARIIKEELKLSASISGNVQ